MSVNEEGLISKSLTFKVEGMVMIPVLVFMVFALYVFNVKPIIANTSLIKALNTNTTDDKKNAMDNFKRAYESSRLGRPEVVEWISSSAPTILADDKISFEERNKYFEFATKAIESVTKDLEIDPRYEMVAGNFYSSVGSSEIALNHLNRAKEVMPEKQMIYFALGQLAIRDGKTKESLEYFKQAYELAPEYEESQIIYLVGAVYAKDYTLIDSLLKIISPEVLINDTRVLSVMYQTGQKNLLLSTLRSIKNKLPERSDQIDEYIKQIESGKI
jgi:tetratricopeptide (TPR) repeat protein